MYFNLHPRPYICSKHASQQPFLWHTGQINLFLTTLHLKLQISCKLEPMNVLLYSKIILDIVKTTLIFYKFFENNENWKFGLIFLYLIRIYYKAKSWLFAAYLKNLHFRVIFLIHAFLDQVNWLKISNFFSLIKNRPFCY